MAAYHNGAMVPDRTRMLAAQYIKRDPVTQEISWPPDDAELELMDLGLIPWRKL